MMFAVVREATYPLDGTIPETPEFRAFQDAHSNREGYLGTVVVEIGPGRLLTLTLWRTPAELISAREAMTSVVARTIQPLMTSPAKLLGVGPVVFADVGTTDREPIAPAPAGRS